MKLIIMRHAECVGLKENVINGWKDFELTKAGKEEAVDVVDKLKYITGISSIDCVYSSYLSRTRDTAKYVLEGLNQELDIIQDIRLNERHYGMFQGMKRNVAYTYSEYNTLSLSAERLDNKLIPMLDEDYEKQVEEYSQKLNVDKDWLADKLPKSESILDVEKRLKEFAKEKIFIQDNKNKTILIVGHANTVKLLVKYIEKLSYQQTTQLRFATCGMRIYELDYIGDRFVINNTYNINKEWNR